MGRLIKLTIDGRALEADAGLTILQAAERAGIEIPHFCYHPAFPPEGSCRMCLVEIEGFPKLELACSTAIREGQRIMTRSPRVLEARKAVLEFLLADHPLDCPVCDKAGECLLQNYYSQYGLFDSRIKEPKEKREKLVRIGEKLILDRERCVLCTRCVRFLKDVTGTGELGVVDRGHRSEIGFVDGEPVAGAYSGNLVDLCPVGAITDASFRFQSRAWFLTPRPSVCPGCGRGCGTWIDVPSGFPRVKPTRRAYRIRPRENPDVNGYWICDAGRYGLADLEAGRHDRLIQRKGGRETVLTWDKAATIIAPKLRALVDRDRTTRAAVVLNTALTNEELFLAQRLFRTGLGIAGLLVADPADGEADGFLRTAERTPNRRGAAEIGVERIAPDLRGLADRVDLLLIFGHHLAGAAPAEDLAAALKRIEAKYLWASHRSALDELVDIVIPTPVVAEKSGTLTNASGRVQAIEPALAFCADGAPEWRALLDLALALGLDPGFYAPLDSPAAVFEAMKKELPFFR